MDYVRLGSTGLKVSRLCLGTMTYGTPAWRPWVLDESASRPFFKRAIERGINFFDTADMYSRGVSEQVVGRALKEYAKRDEIVVATKVFYPVEGHPNGGGLSRKHIMSAIDASLRRLGMDYVDLYQIHRFDDDTPIEETLEALHDVVHAGKALYIGASTMYAYQFVKMICTQRANGWTEFVSMQNHYNLVYREEERETIPFCCRGRHRRHSVEPAGAGIPGRQSQARRARRRRYERQHDNGATRCIRREDYDIADRVVEVAKRKGVAADPGGAVLGREQARRHRADRRRDAARAARSAGRRPVRDADAGRDRGRRRTVRAAQSDRDRLARDFASALAT